MKTLNPHDDLQRATSVLRNIHTPEGLKIVLEIRSDYDVVTQRWGELWISEKGIRMQFEFGSPIKAI